MCGILKLLMEIIINTNSEICPSAGEDEPLIGLALVICCQTVAASLIIASFPGLKRAWFQPFAHALNRCGIPQPPHTIDILPYIHDVLHGLWTYCGSILWRAKNSHPAPDLKQNCKLPWSWLTGLHVPTDKTITKGNLGYFRLPFLMFFTDKQRKIVC